MLDRRHSRFRRAFLLVGALVACGSLAYRFIVEPKDRLTAVIFAAGVLELVLSILTKSKGRGSEKICTQRNMRQRTLRLIFLGAGVLIVWGSLGYRFIRYPDRMDRLLAVCVGVGVTILAVLILRGPVLPRSGGWDVDGMGSSPDGDGLHSHHGDDGGHGGTDGDGH